MPSAQGGGKCWLLNTFWQTSHFILKEFTLISAQIYWETKAPDQNIFKYSCNPLQSLQLINYNYTRCQNIRQTGQKNESPATMLDRNLEKKKIN